jgi:hypothetical protein|uniref:Uncharacterized protein n=1 Tax=viral metagenome TaxID=1070528 RepID=A0A6C0BGJ1_9ZZZZ
MENLLVVLILAVCLFIFVASVIYIYVSSNISQNEENKTKSTSQNLPSFTWDQSSMGIFPWFSKSDVSSPTTVRRRENLDCRKSDLKELKKLLKIALVTIRSNIITIRSNKILTMRPAILLTMYPFYIDVLKLPKYLAYNQCYTRNEVMQALHELYGPDLEIAPDLHVKVPSYGWHYILIDLYEAIDYYQKFEPQGIEDLV